MSKGCQKKKPVTWLPDALLLRRSVTQAVVKQRQLSLSTQGVTELPKLDIIEQKGKITTPPYAITKDGREFAYAESLADARLVKLAVETWWLESKKYARD